jgi:lipoate-protein ligase A
LERFEIGVKMYLLDLGEKPWEQSMLIFHTLARMGVEAVDIVWPQTPFISIGYFQDAKNEVDIEYCKNSNLPIFRREVGGGTVYLDRNQIFYHVIWNKDNPNFPRRIKDIYEYLSVPPIETYEEFGIPTKFHEVNDIVTSKGNKIAGLGGADIDDSMVFVGSIMRDFNCDAMSHAIKVPDEKFRDKIYKTMEENVTNMKKEIGKAPSHEEIKKILIKKYEKLLGKLKPLTLNEEIIKKMMELAKWFNSPDFLYRKTPRIPKGVKIKEGIEILYGIYKAKGGLIRTAQEVENRHLNDIGISGDFTLYPKNELQNLEFSLKDTEREKNEIISKIDEFYEDGHIQTPGVKSKDFTTAIMEAK